MEPTTAVSSRGGPAFAVAVLRGSVATRDEVEHEVVDVLIDAIGHIGFRRLGASPGALAVEWLPEAVRQNAFFA